MGSTSPATPASKRWWGARGAAGWQDGLRFLQAGRRPMGFRGGDLAAIHAGCAVRRDGGGLRRRRALGAARGDQDPDGRRQRPPDRCAGGGGRHRDAGDAGRLARPRGRFFRASSARREIRSPWWMRERGSSSSSTRRPIATGLQPRRVCPAVGPRDQLPAGRRGARRAAGAG